MARLPEHLSSTPAGEEQISPAVLGEHQRGRVLAAAIPLFAKRGYLGTTVDDILAAAKVGVGNFYDLFEGKEDCFLGCFDQVVGAARTQMTEAAEAGSDWSERTYLGLRALIGAMLASPLEARLALVEAQSAGPEALSRYNALLDEGIAWLGEGRSVNPGARELPAGFGRTAVSGLAFYLQQCLLGAVSVEPGRLIEEAAGLVIEPIVGAAELRRLRSLAAQPA